MIHVFIVPHELVPDFDAEVKKLTRRRKTPPERTYDEDDHEAVIGIDLTVLQGEKLGDWLNDARVELRAGQYDR